MSTPNVHSSGRQAARKRGVAKGAVNASNTAVKPNSSATHNSAIVNGEQREAMIREAAYFRSESRGFCPGQVSIGLNRNSTYGVVRHVRQAPETTYRPSR